MDPISMFTYQILRFLNCRHRTSKKKSHLETFNFLKFLFLIHFLLPGHLLVRFPFFNSSVIQVGMSLKILMKNVKLQGRHGKKASIFGGQDFQSSAKKMNKKGEKDKIANIYIIHIYVSFLIYIFNKSTSTFLYLPI